MAAASAGSVQTGNIPVLNTLAPPLSHQQLDQQQQSQEQQRLPYVQRAEHSGNQNLVNNCSTTIVTTVQQRGANVAPGWRRHLSNGEIVYIRYVLLCFYIQYDF